LSLELDYLHRQYLPSHFEGPWDLHFYIRCPHKTDNLNPSQMNISSQLIPESNYSFEYEENYRPARALQIGTIGYFK